MASVRPEAGHDAQGIARGFGLGLLAACDSLIHYVLSDMELTYKKRHSVLANRNRPDIARVRKACRHQQLGFDPARLVFIDESNAKTNITCLRGRTLRGKRL